MIDSTNLSNAEYFRLNGNMSNDRIESLLELEAVSKEINLDNLSASLEEISGAFPNEDFAEDIIWELEQLAATLNDERVYRILSTLENRVIQVINEANYGVNLVQELIDNCPEEN